MRSLRDQIGSLNREMVQMADFTNPLWNAGARFWLEHRGPEVARAIHALPGLKLWLLAPPDGDLSYAAKLAALLGDHVVVGHAGPLPPHHCGLAFPWRLDHGTEIPDPDAPRKLGMAIEYQIRVDAVRRPLPPRTSRQCLLGDLREGLMTGLVSYLPASVVFSPLPREPWPNPAEILERPGTLPSRRRTVYHNPSKPEEPPVEVVTNYDGDPGTMRELPDPLPHERQQQSSLPEPTIGDRGFFEVEDPRVYNDIWEWNEAAIRWEVLFASYLAAGSLTASSADARANMQPLPSAVLRLRLPYLEQAPWEVLEQMRERERDALENLRTSVLGACQKLKDVRGPRLNSEVRHLQETVIDKGVAEVQRSFKAHNWRRWGKAVGFGVRTATISVASYLGLPPLGALVAGGYSISAGVNLAMDLRKEEEEWLRRARGEMPMYFVWRLGRESRRT
jgi:hypothetical protein